MPVEPRAVERTVMIITMKISEEEDKRHSQGIVDDSNKQQYPI